MNQFRYNFEGIFSGDYGCFKAKIFPERSSFLLESILHLIDSEQDGKLYQNIINWNLVIKTGLKICSGKAIDFK